MMGDDGEKKLLLLLGLALYCAWYKLELLMGRWRVGGAS